MITSLIKINNIYENKMLRVLLIISQNKLYNVLNLSQTDLRYY